MENQVILTGKTLTIEELQNIVYKNYKIIISDEALKNTENAYNDVINMINNDKVAYGVTTGFGSLSNVAISKDDCARLSRNIVRSHAIAVGEYLEDCYVKASIAVRINALIKGHSGVNPKTILILTELINKNIIPMVPRYGSLACSGDLCLLSHVMLVISKNVDEDDNDDGLVKYNNEIMSGSKAFELAGLEKVLLGPKEGLALTNGSTFTVGILALLFGEVEKLLKLSNICTAMALEAHCGVSDAFENIIHELRNNEGQKSVSKIIRKFIKNSKLVNSLNHIQDSYSLRCAPQVLGAVVNEMDLIKTSILNEINAVTDNPILVKKSDIDDNDKSGEKVFISGGNFHGELLGFQADKLKILLTELSSISERRLSRLLDGKLNRGLPDMLIKDAGLNSGYMITQYTSVSLVLRNIKLAFPSTVLSLPTCANQEDHNSNAYNAVLDLASSINILYDVFAFEIIANTRAIELREEMNIGDGNKYYYNEIYNLLEKTQKEHCIKNEYDRVKNKIITDEFYNFYDDFTEEKIIINKTNNLSTPSGMIDNDPEEMILRKKLYSIAREKFDKHGGKEIKTPVLERKDILTGKYGDNEKLIFELDDQGGAELCLRYDHTVPLARYVVSSNKLDGFNRYVIGEVYRRDNPSIQQGRLREFTQMDFDMVGNYDLMVADAECLTIMSEIYNDILYEFDENNNKIYQYKIKYNDRRIHDYLLKLNNIINTNDVDLNNKKINSFCSSIDKLDKEPWSNVKEELLRKGFNENAVNNIEEYVCLNGEPFDILNLLKSKFYPMNEEIENVLNEIELLFNYLESFGCLDKIIFDLSLARGLDYYTSTVFEAVCIDKSLGVGSIGGGGRYDNLIGSMFSKSQRKVPAVGMSVGVDRVLAILRHKENNKKINNVKFYITIIPSKNNEQLNKLLFKNILSISTTLRNNGFNTEIVKKKSLSIKEQIINCINNNIPYMFILGENEFSNNTIQLKKLETKEVINIDLNSIIEYLFNNNF